MMYNVLIDQNKIITYIEDDIDESKGYTLNINNTSNKNNINVEMSAKSQDEKPKEIFETHK